MYYDPVNDGNVWPADKPLNENNLSRVERGLYRMDAALSELVTLMNLSFELDADGDGIPDGWERIIHPGGAVILDTENALHGKNCVKFIHPGGDGNGGGCMISPPIPVSEFNYGLYLNFILWASREDVKVIVKGFFYNKNREYIADTTLYQSEYNPTVPTMIICPISIPLDARFMRLSFNCGDPSVDVSGSIYLDGVEIRYGLFDTPDGAGIAEPIPEVSRESSSWGAVATTLIRLNRYLYYSLPVRLSFKAEFKSDSSMYSAYMRFRCGDVYSNEARGKVTSYTNVEFTIDIPAGMDTITLQMQLRGETGGTRAYGRWISNLEVTTKYNPS